MYIEACTVQNKPSWFNAERIQYADLVPFFLIDPRAGEPIVIPFVCQSRIMSPWQKVVDSIVRGNPTRGVSADAIIGRSQILQAVLPEIVSSELVTCWPWIRL